MKIKDFFNSLRAKWEAVVIITIVAATFGLYLNFFLPHYYRATSEFLIVQKQNPNIDAYTAIKGSEQLAYTFRQVILSPAFFDAISRSNFDIEIRYFGKTPEKIIKKWQKTAVIETLPNTGILKINIFHPENKEAQKITQAVAYILNNERHLFLGNNQEIDVITLSKTIVGDKFAKPNALANTFLGLVAGLFASTALVVFFPQRSFSMGAKREITKTKSIKKKWQLKKATRETFPHLTKKTAAPSNLPIA